MTKEAGILITGATGLIGTRLRNLLFGEKMQYSILSRNSVKLECPVFQWNPEENAVPPNAFNNVHTIVNLAGTGIADKKWSEKRKKEILRSRVDSLDTSNQGIIQLKLSFLHLLSVFMGIPALRVSMNPGKQEMIFLEKFAGSGRPLRCALKNLESV